MRMSGFQLYLLILIMFIPILIGGGVLASGQSISLLWTVVGVVFSAWLIITMGMAIALTKVKISDGFLFTQTNTQSGARLFPKAIEEKTDLTKIKSVVIGDSKYIKENISDAAPIQALEKIIQTILSNARGGTNGLAMSIAINYTPFIIATGKDASFQPVCLLAKPFSKRALKKFVFALKSNGVQVLTEPVLHLE